MKKESELEVGSEAMDKQAENQVEVAEDVKATDETVNEASPMVGEQPETEQPVKKKSAKKKVFAIIGAITAVVVLIAGLGIGYYQFLYKVDINPMDDLAVTVIGVDGYGMLRFDSSQLHHEDENINAALQLLRFDYEPKEFSNGDTVTITLVDDQPLFNKYKLNPTVTSKTITIDSLIGIPNNWADVPNQQALIDASNEKAKSFFDGIYSSLDQYVKNKFGSDVGIEGSHNLRAVAYRTSSAIACSEHRSYSESCGNAVMIYTGNPIPYGGIYYTGDNSETVYLREWNYIHITPEGELGEYDEGSAVSLKRELWDMTFDETIKKLEEYGYTIIWM